MCMYNSIDISACFENGTVDDPLRIRFQAGLRYNVSIEVDLQDVLARHRFGCDGVRNKKRFAVLGVPHAYMSQIIEDPLMREDSVCENQLTDSFSGCFRVWIIIVPA